MTLRFRALWPGSSDYSIKPPFLGFRSSKAFVVVVVSFMVFTVSVAIKSEVSYA